MYLTPEQFAQNYPDMAQPHSWDYHLRKWRRAGRLVMHEDIMPRRHGRQTRLAYSEEKVLQIIQEDREGVFCARVWWHYRDTVIARIEELKS